MNRKNNQGFTLVELIVVVTILSILATIGYISFQGYASAARDSSRVHNISVIARALEYHKLKNNDLFEPENVIPITLSGTIVGLQGDMGSSNLGIIGITEGGTDPLDGEYYSYFLSGNKAQILALLENSQNEILGSISNKTYAATDYSHRYPYFKGTGLGMILEENNTPIHKSEDVMLEGQFEILNPLFSVKKVKSLYHNGDQSVMPALMILGQLSLNSNKSSHHECPLNFIPVPGNSDLGQPAFCIGQYEASAPGNNDTLPFDTLPGVTPLTNINHDINIGDCRLNGDKYHMMTMMEWLTLVRNIEQVNSNWSNGLVGSGHIIGGNNGNTDTGFSYTTALQTGDDSSVSPENNEKRQLKLSNGEIIWDLIGNNWEAVKTLNLYIFDVGSKNELNTTVGLGANIYKNVLDLFPIQGTPSSGTYYSWSNITDIDFKTLFGPKILSDKTQGIGTVRRTANHITVVGGDYNESVVGSYENGLYSIIKTSLLANPNVSTRCAYSY